jgi:myosin heavy subunit
MLRSNLSEMDQKLGFNDMINMEVLNDAELMHNLVTRFLRGIIFTYVGPTLLVVNPFRP